MADLQALSCRWNEHIAALSGTHDGAEASFARLVAAYSEPHRYYHNLDHITEVLDLIDELAGLAKNLAVVRLAGWFHDVVYNPRAKDNEARSADVALAALSGLRASAAALEQLKALILVTTHTGAVTDADGAVLVDADLGILGTPPPRYDAYAAAIRREYAWVSGADYRRGRALVLEAFLQRPRIFSTPLMVSQREALARGNLTRELTSLRIEA